MSASPAQFEPFVSADRVAEFLCLTRRHILELARAGHLPAHPIGGTRKIYRFLLSEVHAWLKRRNG